MPNRFLLQREPATPLIGFPIAMLLATTIVAAMNESGLWRIVAGALAPAAVLAVRERVLAADAGRPSTGAWFR